MNERIKELELEAIAYADSKVPPTNRYNDIYHSIIRGKFAELIIRNCLSFIEPMPGSGDIDDIALERATKEIKEHFGVKE